MNIEEALKTLSRDGNEFELWFDPQDEVFELTVNGKTYEDPSLEKALFRAGEDLGLELP